MAKWDNHKLISQRTRVDSSQFSFLSCVYQELNKQYNKTQEQNVNICIVRSPSHLFITCISL